MNFRGGPIVLVRVVSGGVFKSRASDRYSSDVIIEGKLRGGKKGRGRG